MRFPSRAPMRCDQRRLGHCVSCQSPTPLLHRLTAGGRRARGPRCADQCAIGWPTAICWRAAPAFLSLGRASSSASDGFCRWPWPVPWPHGRKSASPAQNWTASKRRCAELPGRRIAYHFNKQCRLLRGQVMRRSQVRTHAAVPFTSRSAALCRPRCLMTQSPSWQNCQLAFCFDTGGLRNETQKLPPVVCFHLVVFFGEASVGENYPASPLCIGCLLTMIANANSCDPIAIRLMARAARPARCGLSAVPYPCSYPSVWLNSGSQCPLLLQ